MYYLLYDSNKNCNKFLKFLIVGTNEDGVTNKLSLIRQNPNSAWGSFEEILRCTETWDDYNPEDFDTWFKESHYALITQSASLPFSTVLSDAVTFADLQDKYPEYFI